MKLHLPKMLLTAVLAAISTAAYSADTEIWVNFGNTNEGVTDDTKVWNNILGNNAEALTGSYVLVDSTGAECATLNLTAIRAPWGNGDATLDVLKGYLDYDASMPGWYWSLNIELLDDIAASNITVNAYNSGDSTSPIAPYNINGNNYVGSTETDGTYNNISDSSWGNAETGALQTELNRYNTVTAKGLSGIISMTPTQTTGNSAGRASLAGLSIVWDGSSSATDIELTSGENDAAEYLDGVTAEDRVYSLTGNTDGTSEFKIAGGETVQGLQAAANTVAITSDGSISVSRLWAKTGATLNLNASLTEGADLVIGGLGLVNINTNQALNNLTVSGTMNVGEGVEVSVRNTDAGFLSNTIGKGTVNLEETARYNGSMSSAFAGIINVAAGKSLYLGDNQADEYDLSDATIKLNKGSRFELQSVGSQLNKLDVADTSTLHVEDGDTGATALRINSVDIAAGKSLIVTNHWEGDLIIENLNAEGSLDLQTSMPEAFKVYLGTDSDSALNIGATISNTGALTVNGSITITNDLSAFVIHTQAADGTLTENEGQDGYMTTIGSTYYLVDNSGSGTCTFTPTTAIYDGKTINLTQDATTGDVTFVGGTSIDTVYRVNTKDVIVGGTSATDNTGRATAFIVAQGRAVTIADGSDAASASDILLNSSGDGNVILAKDTTIEGGQQTQVTGKLTINDGVTLTVGTGYTDRSNISSFKGGVELAGGSLMINGAGQEVNSLTVSKASTLGIANQWQGRQTYTLTGTTRLNADLEYTNSVAGEHGELVIKNLSGSGVLSTNGGSGTWGANALKVEKLTEYTGTIKVDGGNRANNRNYVEFGTSTTEGEVTTKASAFTTLKGLELTNKAYATVHSTGNSTIEKVVLNNGSLEYTSNGGGYTYTLGDVTSEGASSISTDSGRVEIDKLTLNSGQLSMTGSLTIGELVLDLSRYTDMSQSYTLVTATGEGASVGLTNAYSTKYNGYTATVSGSGSTSLTLSFEKIDWSLTGAPAYDELSNMLTLNVNADLQGYDFTENGAIIIPGIGDAMMKDILGLSGLPGDGLVGITLVGADGAKVTASGDNQIGFQGNGGIYYGQAGTGNVDWVYQAAYIPEPATTTLSLLALTALAARRRRK